MTIHRETVGWGTWWGVLKPAQRCAGLSGSGLWGSPPCSSHCELPASLPLRRSLSTPPELVHHPGVVNMLTFQLPTCHHPSQAIRIIVQEFPPGSGMNGEQEGSELPVEVGLRGKDTGWEGAGATTTLPALNEWGDRPSEEEGLARG